MDFTNFAILYLLIVLQVGGYYWLKKAARKEKSENRIYKYLHESYMLISLFISFIFELIVMAL